MSAIERAYLDGFRQAAREIRKGFKTPNPWLSIVPSPAYRKGYFAGWSVAK